MDAGAAAVPDLGPQLIAAATQGNVAQLGALLDQGADIEARGDHGASAQHFACERGHREVVALLLSRGANIDALCTLGSTPIIWASCNGNLEVVKLLQSRGANIHYASENGFNAMHAAALFDKLSVCEFLLSKGMDLMAAYNDGRTALSHYGHNSNPALSPETKALRIAALHAAHIAYWRGVQAADRSIIEARDRDVARLSAVTQTTTSLLFSDAFSDLVFVCAGGERIHAHRNIVAMCSPHMNALLQGPWAENAGGHASEVKMPQSAEAVRALLKFMYTGEVDAAVCISHTMDVLDLASQHEQPDLKAACATLIGNAISLLSLGRILEIAVLRDLAALEAKCIAFVETHIAELLLFEIVQFANKHGIPELKAACERGAVVTLETANVMPYLEDALRFDLSQLKRACIAFVEQNFSKLNFSTRVPSADEQLSLPELVEFSNKYKFPELKAACERGCIANLKSVIPGRRFAPTLKHACIALLRKGLRLEEWSKLVHFANEFKSPELKEACERGAIATLSTGNVESYLMTALDHKLDALKDACLAFVQKNMAQLSLPKLVEVARECSVLLEACDMGAVAALGYTNALDYVEIALSNDTPLLKHACLAFVQKNMAELSLPHFVQLADAYANPELRAACERGIVVTLTITNVMPFLEDALNLDLPLLNLACVAFVEEHIAQFILPKLIQYADKHNIPELRAACQRGAIAALSTANAVSYLEVAIHHDLSFLHAACIKKVFFPSP